MHRVVGFGLAAVAAMAVAGCGSGGSGETPTKGMPTASGAPISGDIEVAAFKGGYGIDAYEQAGKEFEAKHPGVKVKVDGNPRVWDQLRPRLVSGNPPDLMFPGWGLDHWALVEEGQLLQLDEALDSKPEGSSSTWRDSFEPAILKLGQKDGKQWVLPYFFSVLGWWYNPAQFQENGWTIPKTYEELLTLCEKIKAKGIAPITFQGKYPDYMLQGMLIPWVISIGGMEAYDAMQNLEPGAWKSPAFIEAAKRIIYLRDKGYLQAGATGMSHTESQTEFVNGRAAMIPCGTWLDSEMKSVMPPGTKIAFFLPPVMASGKGDPTAVGIKIEPWMIPSKAKNPRGGIALFEYMTSLPVAQKFVKDKGTLMAIKGANDIELPAVLVDPAKIFKDSKSVWSPLYDQWYTEMAKEVENGITSMLNGQLTAEQYADRCEAAAEKTRQNSSIAKHTVPK